MEIGVLDLFCGCGGTSAGFLAASTKEARIRILAGIDFDQHACRTYARNTRAPVYCKDVRAFAAEPAKLLKLLHTQQAPDQDRLIMIGCAPCQGFAAHRKAIEGRDDRRHLFIEFAHIASSVSPDAIFIENVPDIFSKKHWNHYSEGRRILEAAGYTVRSRIYNFAGFGLPQERFRAVMVAFKHDFPVLTSHLTPGEYRTVRDALGHLPPLKAGKTSPGDPMHRASNHRRSTIDLLSNVPKDGGNRPIGVGPGCLDRARENHGGYTDVYGRLAWDKPAVTITARCRTPSCGRFAHPEQNRGLSVREAALLQGFAADYYFEGPFDDKFKQIGNAVSPLVARSFAEHMVGILLHPQTAVQAAASQDRSEDVNAPVGPGFAVTINGIKRRRDRAESIA